MKTVLIVAEWINLSGGVTRTLLELLRRIDPDEYDVTLYVMRPDKSDLSAVPTPISVVTSNFGLPYAGAQGVLQQLMRKGMFVSVLQYLAALVAWKRTRNRAAYVRFFIRRHPAPARKYDIAVNYAMLDSYSNQYVADRVDALRKVMWCHTDMTMYSDQSLLGLEAAFSQYHAINCVSRDVERSFLSEFPSLASRTRVRYNPINDAEIRRLSREYTPELGAVPIHLTTVGRVSPEKGIDLLLLTASKLRDEGYDFIWWVIGSNHDADFAAAMTALQRDAGLEEAVQFVGVQRNPYPYMAQCDIYVQPSRIEGYGMATVEAKILCKAVIRTNTSGALEQFENGVNGSIVSATVDGLVAEIKRLIDHPEVRHVYEHALAGQTKSNAPEMAALFE